MSVYAGPEISTSGLVMHVDAANTKSYPGSGSTWTNIVSSSNTVTLVNGPTYSSSNSGGIVFDGTNDYANPSINHSYLSSSAIEVVFKSAAHSTGYRTIVGYRHNDGYSLPTIGSLYLSNSTLSASVITASQVYRTATAATSISVGTTYHAVLNKNTSTGNLEIFLNGATSGSQTFDAATYGQWTTAGQFIGADILDIAKSTNTNVGQGWSADYFNGTIFFIKLYSRVLTAAEIKQNYYAVRGRFGI